MSKKKPIFVTQPYLPPFEEFVPYLQEIWDSKILTNNGPFHQQLEEKLCDYLGIEHISLFTNCTIALITALRALNIQGEVITTPYSFVATAHSLLWNGNRPRFVDVDAQTLNIDASLIEAAITENTKAIMPVHCYGHPCDVDVIQAIADKHSLAVIYDAAHAFGVNCHCGSILNHGDLSVLSFHATKVFNTFEGGAIVCPDEETKRTVDHLKNFGFEDEVTVTTQGINGKMSEFNAAVGLAQLNHIDDAIEERQLLDSAYREGLASVCGIQYPGSTGEQRANYSYFPILVDESFPCSRDELYDSLKQAGVFTRRYFFPLISNFPMYAHLKSARPENLPVANKAADQILCLPIYPGLSAAEQAHIIETIANA